MAEPKAGIYASASGPKAIGHRRTTDLQVSACQVWARASGIVVCRRVIDPDPPSLGLERPRLRRLLAAVQESVDLDEKLFDFLLVDKIRRLATPPTAAAFIVGRFAAFGVQVLSVLPDEGLKFAALINEHVGAMLP